MNRLQFALSGGLSQAQLALLHDALLQLLNEVGLACAHPPTVELVTACEGIRYEGGRLKFSPDLVNATIAQARLAGQKRQPTARVVVSAPWNCFNVIDLETDQVRASTAADCVEMLKLVASCNQEGPPPVYPCDLDARIQVLWLEKLGIELAPGFGGALVTHDPETMRWIGELYAVVGRRYDAHYQYVVSPLTLDHAVLDLYWTFKDDPQVGAWPSLCPIPVGGLTAPLTTSGLLAQGLAESFGGLIVAQRLGTAGLDTVPALRVDFGDMRDLTVGYSLPENVMVQVLLRDVAAHFCGFRKDDIYLNTNAKRPDAFAAVDRMGYMLLLGLAGFRHFHLGAGQMSMDEVFSPAQFIIDLEIGRYVQQVLDGITWSGDPASIASTVTAGIAEGSFLTHASTLEMLPQFFDSTLFRRNNVGQWRAAGETTIEQAARARAREAIASYRYALEPTVQRDVDRVFARACQALGVDLAAQPISWGPSHPTSGTVTADAATCGD
jgi:trimethylamine:corrinoid methyltransferase-like protein